MNEIEQEKLLREKRELLEQVTRLQIDNTKLLERSRKADREIASLTSQKNALADGFSLAIGYGKYIAAEEIAEKLEEMAAGGHYDDDLLRSAANYVLHLDYGPHCGVLFEEIRQELWNEGFEAGIAKASAPPIEDSEGGLPHSARQCC
jgi:hypothetical protein